MRVVSNTSPLSNLAIIGHLGLVREQLGTLLIPPAVRAELLRNPHAEARLAVEAAMEARFFANPVLERTLLISVGES